MYATSIFDEYLGPLHLLRISSEQEECDSCACEAIQPVEVLSPSRRDQRKA